MAISKFVPRTDGTGSIGTSNLAWGEGHFNNATFKQDITVEGGATVLGASTLSTVNATNLNVTQTVEYAAGAISYMGESKPTPADQGTPLFIAQLDGKEIGLMDGFGSFSTTTDGFNWSKKKMIGINSRVIYVSHSFLPGGSRRLFAKLDRAGIPGAMEYKSSRVDLPSGQTGGVYSDDMGDTWHPSSFTPAFSYLVGDPYASYHIGSNNDKDNVDAFFFTPRNKYATWTGSYSGPYEAGTLTSLGDSGVITTSSGSTPNRISYKKLYDSLNGLNGESANAGRNLKAWILSQNEYSSTRVEGVDFLKDAHNFGNGQTMSAAEFDAIPLNLPTWFGDPLSDDMYLTKPSG